MTRHIRLVQRCETPPPNSRPLPAEADVMYLWKGTTWAGKAIPEVEPCSLSRYIKDHIRSLIGRYSPSLCPQCVFQKLAFKAWHRYAPPIAIQTAVSSKCKMQRQRLKSLPADTCTIRKKAIRIRCFLNKKLCCATIISCSFRHAILSRACSVCFEVAVDLGIIINTSILLLSRGFPLPSVGIFGLPKEYNADRRPL